MQRQHHSLVRRSALHAAVPALACPWHDAGLTQCGACRGAGHRFIEKYDLQALCGIDTTAPVGTTYSLEFLVFDSALASASVYRTIVIVSPCLSTQYECPGLDGEGIFCSDVPCSATEAIRSANVVNGTGIPTLTLLLPLSDLSTPGYDRTYDIPFGTAQALSLAPCASSVSTQGCAATATASDGTDLTSLIQFSDVSPCKTYPSISSSCYTCLASAVQAGTCLPGVYDFQYSVTAPDTNNTATALVRVYIEQYTTYDLVVTFNPSAASLSDAQAQADSLTNSSSAALSFAELVLPTVVPGINMTE